MEHQVTRNKEVKIRAEIKEIGNKKIIEKINESKYYFLKHERNRQISLIHQE